MLQNQELKVNKQYVTEPNFEANQKFGIKSQNNPEATDIFFF